MGFIVCMRRTAREINFWRHVKYYRENHTTNLITLSADNTPKIRPICTCAYDYIVAQRQKWVVKPRAQGVLLQNFFFIVASFHSSENVSVHPVAIVRFVMHSHWKGKKAKLSICLTKHHAMKAYWGSGGISPPAFFDIGPRWRWVVRFTSQPLYPQGKETLVPIG
jgi:hypothetical protein